MKRLSLMFLAAMSAAILTAPSVWASAEWKIQQAIKPAHPPVDMLVSANKMWIYVLDDQGWISIYDANGQLKDKIKVGTEIRQIKAAPGDNALLLLNRKSGAIQEITIDFVEDIEIEDSPVKGRPDAPVSIVVFSDFQ